MSRELEVHLRGAAREAIREFYDLLPRIPRDVWPEMIHGMGYNFEYYDALLALLLVNVQLSLDDTDYSARHRAVQLALLPFCSEYGVELERPLQPDHRHLYAEFHRVATGREQPERYAASDSSPWLSVSRRWAEHMTARIARAGASAAARARYAIGYYWAVEHLSIYEFEAMREAWAGVGVRAEYLDAHCEVEGEHNSYSAQAALTFAAANDPVLVEAIRDHDDDLAGFYRDLCQLVASEQRGPPARSSA